MDTWPTIQTGLGIIIMIFVGYIVTKVGAVDPASFKTPNQFLFRCCYMGLIVGMVYGEDLGAINWLPLGVIALAAVCTQLVLLLCILVPTEDRFGSYLEVVLPATNVNYLIIGDPIYKALWPEASTKVLAIVTMSNDIVSAPLYLIMAGVYAWYRRNKEHEMKSEPREPFDCKVFRDVVLRFVTSPIVIGYVIGFIWAGIGIKIPVAIADLVWYTSKACLGLATLAIGGFLQQNALIACKWWQFVICCVARHVVQPLFCALLASPLGLVAGPGRQVVLLAALPSSVASYMLAASQAVGTGVASTMLFWSNLLFLPAVLAWIALLDALEAYPNIGT